MCCSNIARFFQHMCCVLIQHTTISSAVTAGAEECTVKDYISCPVPPTVHWPHDWPEDLIYRFQLTQCPYCQHCMHGIANWNLVSTVTYAKNVCPIHPTLPQRIHQVAFIEIEANLSLEAGWKLLLLNPWMILHPHKRGGKSGMKEANLRVQEISGLQFSCTDQNSCYAAICALKRSVHAKARTHLYVPYFLVLPPVPV